MNKREEIGDKDDDEHIVFTVQESESSQIMFDTSEEGQVFNFNNPDVNSSDEFVTLSFITGLPTV